MSNQLYINPSVTYGGVLDFDGDSFVFNSGGDPSVYEILQGNKKLEFKLWLDSSIFTPTGTFGQGLVDFAIQDASDYLGVSGYNSEIRFYVNGNGFGTFPENGVTIDIDNSHLNRVLQFEITKTVGDLSGDGSILSVKIDDVDQTITKMGSGLGRGTSRAQIGYFSAALQIGTIWDIKITDTDSQILEHYWEGYPSGNTNAAWEDAGNGEKSFDMVLSGGGPYNTRDITGYSGGGSVSLMSRKLEINQSVEYGTLNWDGSVHIAYTPTGIIDPSNNKTIKFKMILDATSGFVHNGVFTFRNPNDTADSWEAELHEDKFGVDTGFSGSDNQSFLLSEFPYGEVFDVEIDKSYRNINYLKVNGVELANQGSLSTASSNTTAIGFCGTEEKQLEDAAIWDFEIYDGTTLLHKFKGYPSGNTFEAWKDLVGNASTGNLVNEFGHEPTIRYIKGTEGDIFSINKKLYLSGITVEQPFLEFITDDVGGSSFDPDFGVTSGTLEWDLGDGSIVNSNSFTHVYSQEGDKTVKVKKGTTGGDLSITSISMADDNIVGPLNLSSFSNLAGVLVVNNNPKLTSISNPVSSGIFTAYRAHDCSLNGILDISGLTGLGGQFNVQKNYNITEILNPVSWRTFSLYWADRNNLTGTLDVSGLTGLGGQFAVYSNPNLTKILNPVSTTPFSMYWVFDCDLTGTLDLTTLTQLGGTFYAHDNLNLTQILNPVSSKTFTYYYAHSCDLTGTLDVSGLTGLGGRFDVHNNKNLTKILNSSSSQTFTNYYAYDCSLSGTLDVSGLTGLGGTFAVYNNNLTNILFASSSKDISGFGVQNNNLTGILDLRGLTGLGGQITIFNNPNLTTILNPDSSTEVTHYWAYDCSLNGTLDVSSFTNFGGSFYIRGNSNLSEIVLPSFARNVTTFDVRDCSLSQSSVDDIFAKLNTYFSSNTPTGSLPISVNGGTNMPPTDGSSNSDILSLETIFSNAGQTLTITINE